MSWIEPQYSREDIDRAGELLAEVDPDDLGEIPEHDEALEIVKNWKSAHSFPLNSFQNTLRQRCRKVDEKAIVVQRLKRLTSIHDKLRRLPRLTLSELQDIGGVRSVVRSAARAERLADLYGESREKYPHRGPTFVREQDYVDLPRNSGYRSIHLIYRYQHTKHKHEVYDGLQVEIQLRSRLQHAWATAVEAVDLITGQRLKLGEGEADWQRFFALMSTAMASEERRGPVPGTPDDTDELQAELTELSDRLNVVAVLQGAQLALDHVPGGLVDSRARLFLLVLNTEEPVLRVRGYRLKDIEEASEEAFKIEREIADDPRKVSVLVRAQSLKALKSGYPNYHMDTTLFLNAVRRAIDE